MKKYFTIACFMVASHAFAVEQISFSFDENAQKLFSAREPRIIEDAITLARSHDGTFVRKNFDAVRQSLARERKYIALDAEVSKPMSRRNMREANCFGQIRKNYAWPYMTQLKNNENGVLVKTLVGTVQSYLMDAPRGPTRKNMRLIKQADFLESAERCGADSSTQADEKAIADYMIQVLDVDALPTQLFIASLQQDCLNLVEIANSVVLDGKKVNVSKIYGYLAIVKNDKEEIDLQQTAQVLEIIPHFAILHTRGDANINALTQAASDEWCAALNLQFPYVATGSTRDEPSVAAEMSEFNAAFLNHIARFYWLYTHACPYDRGCEAITKWMVKVAAGYHGCEIEYHKDFLYRSPFYLNINAFSFLFRNVTGISYIG